MTSIKRIFLLAVALMILLAGCSSPAAQTGNGAQTASASNDLSLNMKTGLGILELEGQTLAIDADQAKTLLPLWQALKSLSSDSNTSPDEIASLNDQIEESMTEAQLQAIDQMNWSDDDLSALLNKYNLSANQAPASNGGSGQSASSSASGAAAGGGMPGGQPPDGGGDMMMAGGAGAVTEVSTSHSALPGQSDRETAGGMNLVVAQAVIQLLQSKIVSA